jgi:hypothetical protein
LLTIAINTKYLRYKNKELSDACVNTEHGFAVCHFLNDNKLPLCNVQLACFERENFEINYLQLLFFREAMDIVKVYVKNVPQCMAFQVPSKILDMLSTIIPIKEYVPDELIPDNRCYKNNFIALVPSPESDRSPKMLQIEDTSHRIYAIEGYESHPGDVYDIQEL